MPPYRPFPYKGFGGGLNLRDGADVVDEDQAIDALNVLFTTRGAVGQRSGFAKLTAVALPQIARTNLCTNPKSGSGVTTDWTNTGLVSFATDASLPGSGWPDGVTTGFECVGNGDNDRAQFSLAVTSGVRYRFSLYAYLDASDGPTIRAAVHNAAGANKASSAILSSVGVLTRLDVDFTADATETWTMRIRQSGAGNTTFHFTAVLIEQASTLGTYFDGDTSYASWSGTPELSTSSFVPLPAWDSLSAFYQVGGAKQIVGGAGGNLIALDSSGDTLAVTTAPTSGPHFFQRFGGPTAEHIYIANGVDTVRRWTGTIFETPAYTGITPDGKFLGLSSTDNRLVCARFDGTAAGNNPSTVRFSNEGDPTKFDADDYVDLHPGDGEEIMGVATWRDLVIVFKQTKFFVFYGNSVDDEGEPQFNYRPVEASVGLVASKALAVSEQGIYFLDRTGIYFTTGAQPSRVSDIVEPIFHGSPSVYYTGGILNDGAVDQVTMEYHDERLWMSFPSGTSGTNDRNLIFDPHEKWWSLANIPAGPMINFRPGNVEELVFGYSDGQGHLGRYVEASAYTADDMDQSGAGGVAIESHWQGGWFDYSTQAVKTIREMKLAGLGQCDVQVARDYRQTPSVTQTVIFSSAAGLYNTGLLYDSGLLYGPATFVQVKPFRKATRGGVFSVIFRNSTLDKSFKIHRLTTHVREARVPSVVRA